MINDARSFKIILVSHCYLNVIVNCVISFMRRAKSIKISGFWLQRWESGESIKVTSRYEIVFFWSSFAVSFPPFSKIFFNCHLFDMHVLTICQNLDAVFMPTPECYFKMWTLRPFLWTKLGTLKREKKRMNKNDDVGIRESRD